MKFAEGDHVWWNRMLATVRKSWFDGQENRCEIWVSKSSHRGLWVVREASLRLAEKKATDE